VIDGNDGFEGVAAGGSDGLGGVTEGDVAAGGTDGRFGAVTFGSGGVGFDGAAGAVNLQEGSDGEITKDWSRRLNSAAEALPCICGLLSLKTVANSCTEAKRCPGSFARAFMTAASTAAGIATPFSLSGGGGA